MRFTKTIIVSFFLMLSFGIFLNAQVQIKRLNNAKPIIDKTLFEKNGIPEDGKNINGPCVIALPDWLPLEKRVNPTAKYYLYFAHHNGSYIRMAWAKEIIGPWQLYNADSTISEPNRGVISLYGDGKTKKILLANSIEISSHIASPIVQIDNENKRFKLFFHGPTKLTSEDKTDQRNFLAYSDDGIQFQKNISPVMLAGSYLYPFNYKGKYYGFSNGGLFHEAPATGAIDKAPKNFDYSKTLWSSRNNFFKEAIAKMNDNDFRVRHTSVYLENDLLHIFFSSSHDTPEQIYYCSANLNRVNSENWKVTTFYPIMRASESWEGGDIEPIESLGGPAKSMINEVRDPSIFKDNDGKLYLFYCAGGERGIGVASLEFVKK